MKECTSFDPCMETMDETKCTGTTGCSWIGTCTREGDTGGETGGETGGDEGGCYPRPASLLPPQTVPCLWRRLLAVRERARL